MTTTHADATPAGIPAMPGFDDPVLDSAESFRAILQAMARPGTPQALPLLPPAPAPLTAEAAAVLLTLLDFETPLWLAAETTVRDHLRFHTGVAMADAPQAASFALAPIAAAAELMPRLAMGVPDYPDRSATLVLLVDGFEGGLPATLSGPGLAAPRPFAPAGADAAFWEAARANAARFPLGVDLLFAGGGHVAGLPRSTRIAAAIEPEEG